MNSLPLCTAPEGREEEYMSLYPVIFPFGEMGGVQDRRINLCDTVVAVNDSTGPGTGGEDQELQLRRQGSSNGARAYISHSLTVPTYHPLV